MENPMDRPLSAYLHDHLGGSTHAIDLVKHLHDQYSDDSLGQFASDLLVEIEADKAVLQGLSDRIGSVSSGLKETAGWLAEKVSRLKLNHGDRNGLGTLEALEFLQLGINGKLALWRALAAVSQTETRLQGVDYERLAARAIAQEAKVEERRLQLARIALGPAANRASTRSN
jgi:hypothetical protein